MLAAAAAIIAGFIALTWSADRFVAGASALAKNLGVSTLVIGILIIGLGTSAPEMLVAAMAASDGNAALAVGNAIGSNITNIALVLGVSALLFPITVRSRILKRELPVILGIALIAVALLHDHHLSFTDGIILITLLVASVSWNVYDAKRQPADKLDEDFSDEIPSDMSMSAAAGWTLFGMILMIAASKLLVWGAVEIATALGVSDLVIGLTIVALGTSLPELAASVIAVKKREFDLALGNVIGSNTFNLLGVMAIPALLAPGLVEDAVVYRDLPIMVGLTAALLIMGIGLGKGDGRINRVEGALLLAVYVGYTAYLASSSTLL